MIVLASNIVSVSDCGDVFKKWELFTTVNPRISSLGAYLFLLVFGWGLFEGGLFEGGLIKLFDKCCINSSLPMLLFSILLQEQSIFKY